MTKIEYRPVKYHSCTYVVHFLIMMARTENMLTYQYSKH